MARSTEVGAPLLVEFDEKGLVKDEDRHGNVRWYFRQKGRPKVRLRQPFGSDAFKEELRCARLGIPYRKTEKLKLPEGPGAQPGSFKWLSLEYLRRGCVGLAQSTIDRKRYCLTTICDMALPGKEQTYGRMPYAFLSEVDIEQIRDAKVGEPNAGNYWVKTLSAMFAWAMKTRDSRGEPLAKRNPATGVDKFRIRTTGFHTWTLAEIKQYRDYHAAGTKPDLGLRLFLFTSLRKSDVAQLGRQHRYESQLEDGTFESRFRMTPRKTAVSTGVEIDIPILPPLLELIETLPKKQMAYLLTEKGFPYTANGLGNAMRDWCDAAGLPNCSAHGLRKAFATITAEDGATTAQLMAMLGWTNSRQADTYTKAAERKRLASAGVKHLKLA